MLPDWLLCMVVAGMLSGLVLATWLARKRAADKEEWRDSDQENRSR